MDYKGKIEAVANIIAKKPPIAPAWAWFSVSGLGTLADELEEAVVIPYNDLRHFPVSTVEGHEGQLVLGYLEGTAIAMQGRFHLL